MTARERVSQISLGHWLTIASMLVTLTTFSLGAMWALSGRLSTIEGGVTALRAGLGEVTALVASIEAKQLAAIAEVKHEREIQIQRRDAEIDAEKRRLDQLYQMLEQSRFNRRGDAATGVPPG